MNERRIRSVVIVGGGTAGWMTAAALAKINEARAFTVTLVESDEIGTIGVGEATIPTIHWFNQLIGLDERAFLRETKATYKLGIEFVGWSQSATSYFHPFGSYGAPGDGSMFYHRWLKARAGGQDTSFEAYSLSTQLARAGKFAPPATDPRSILSTLGYAYHFDASLYAKFLRRHCEVRGIKRVEGKVGNIEQDPETGFVTALNTDRGDRLEADLFIDCTGLRGLLIEATLHAGFDDWSQWLPCDRALAVPTENVGPPAPYTRATTRSAGWQWRIPLQHRTGNGYVYSSAYISDDAAAAELLSNLEGRPLAEPRPIRFKAGARRKAWDKNVIAIGLASGFLEPLESTSIHLIQSGIAKLLSLFPDRDCDPYTAEQYNRVLAAELDSIRDFLVLHYHASSGRSEPLWEYCRKMPVPASLTYREEHFKRTGRIVLSTDELFREASWFAVLTGQGFRPADYNPLADNYPERDNLAHLAQIRSAVRAATERLPMHQAYLDERMTAPQAA